MFLTWLLIVAMVLGGLQALLYRLVALRDLRYTAHFSQANASVGDVIELVEEIRNAKRLPVPWVRLEASFHRQLRFLGHAEVRVALGQEYSQFHRSVFSLPAMVKVKRRHPLVCEQRGVYNLTSATLTAGDLLHIQERARRVELDSHLVVYPRILRLDELPVPAHQWLGETLVKRFVVDDPFMVSGVRDYAPGDPLRLVNWKATARASHLMVHRRDFTADHRILILLNVEEHPEGWQSHQFGERLESGIELAASVAWHAIQKGAVVGVVSNGASGSGASNGSGESGGRDTMAYTQVHIAGGGEQVTEVLDALARLKLESVINFTDLLKQYVEEGLTHCDILIVSAWSGGIMDAYVEDLRGLGNAVAVQGLRPAQGVTSDVR